MNRFIQQAMAEYLVYIGIKSISLNPEAVIRTIRHILEIEKAPGRDER